MANPFDRLRKVVFAAVNKVYGELVLAVWVSSQSGAVGYTGKVLFNDPTAKEMNDTAEFVETKAFIEYLKPAFDGLRLLVDQGKPEVININGLDYEVLTVVQLGDGKTCRAFVQEMNSPYGPKDQD